MSVGNRTVLSETPPGWHPGSEGIGNCEESHEPRRIHEELMFIGPGSGVRHGTRRDESWMSNRLCRPAARVPIESPRMALGHAWGTRAASINTRVSIKWDIYPDSRRVLSYD
jgi:hypothetical protein